VKTERPRISLIVAMSINGVIGRENRLPWHLPADLKRFKELTMGHTIVMGRKTWDSINRLLPGRRTVVVTRNPLLRIEGACVVDSFQAALAAGTGDDEIFVIGGEELFCHAMAHADRIYLTVVESAFEGDTHMPAIDASQWRKASSESYPATAASPLAWRFEIHERIATPSVTP
jgi:dihydrofolate reductase